MELLSVVSVGAKGRSGAGRPETGLSPGKKGERAEQLLLIAIATDIEEVRAMLDDLRTAAGGPRRPPGRSDSANPSQEFCKSRSHSAK
jgi:hypothetical protein